MVIDVNGEELDLLIGLVESRVRELHPTIRRSRVSTCTDSLKHDLAVLQRLEERLRQRPPLEAPTAGPSPGSPTV